MTYGLPISCAGSRAAGWRQLAIVSDYAGLVAVLRERAEALDVSNETLDEVCGLTSGYVGRLIGFGGTRTLGRVSLGCCWPHWG